MKVVEANSTSIEVMEASVEVVEAPRTLHRIEVVEASTSFHGRGASFHKK